jgi:hypothetical protein
VIEVVRRAVATGARIDLSVLAAPAPSVAA